MDQPEYRLCNRVEQAGIDHQTEVENGEKQHHSRGREILYAVQHHRPDLAAKPADQREEDRNQYQREQCRKSIRHDQRHEDEDHRIGQDCQHSFFSSRLAGFNTNRRLSRSYA